ncbi:EPDR1-like protein [Mya arenaria]|uniref:EPDR1-like protein n=1 Tax=Mya arenaria TaxID=6604 RepID=A0ABY7F9H1_MYAAR|nr:EPDR1-like protein [Mya arenaria]
MNREFSKSHIIVLGLEAQFVLSRRPLSSAHFSPDKAAMKTLIALLAFAAVCYGQVPERCESPKQWQGGRLSTVASRSSKRRSFFYDEPGMRIRTIEEIDVGKERDYYDVLQLHKENKEYRVNLRTKKCNVTSIMFPFRQVGVPPEAKFLFMGEFGPASIQFEHLTAVTFAGNATVDNIRYTTTVTYPDCVPIGDNYYNDKTGFVESRYFDISLGISEPEAFLPPSVCM